MFSVPKIFLMGLLQTEILVFMDVTFVFFFMWCQKIYGFMEERKKIVKTTFVFLSFFAAAPGVFGCTDENSWERLIDVICRITTEALF